MNHIRLIDANGRTIDAEARLRDTGAATLARAASGRRPAVYARHPLQREVVEVHAELHWPKDKRSIEWSETIHYRRPRPTPQRDTEYCRANDFVETFVDWIVRIGADRACIASTHATHSNADGRHFGHTPFLKANGTEPSAAGLARSVSNRLISIGFISGADATAMGPGKVLRKYSSSALRHLHPAPECASPQALYERHGHSLEEWKRSYATEPCSRLQEAWQRLSRQARQRANIEDVLLL